MKYWMQILSELRALYIAYQSAHWTAGGGTFYGDHLLFQRLYGNVQDELDSVAEKALGSGIHPGMFDPVSLAHGAATAAQSLLKPGQIIDCLINAEREFVCHLETFASTDGLSLGAENLLAGIADKHEEHIYLLSQRARRFSHSATRPVSSKLIIAPVIESKRKKKKKKKNSWPVGGPMTLRFFGLGYHNVGSSNDSSDCGDGGGGE